DCLHQVPRAPLQGIAAVHRQCPRPERRCERRVQYHGPRLGLQDCGYAERYRLVVGVEQQQEVAVADRLAAAAAALDRTSRQVNPETARELLLPVAFGHLATL